MKKYKILILTILMITYQPVAFSKMSDGDCQKFFKNVSKPDSKTQLAIYENITHCSSYFENNALLLESVISSYQELFKINRSHNHLEPFMAFYEKNMTVVDMLVQKISNKAQRDDFVERLKIAFREFKEGNGE